eukprot:77165-Pleurochrysis_carterae.AAC.1
MAEEIKRRVRIVAHHHLRGGPTAAVGVGFAGGRDDVDAVGGREVRAARRRLHPHAAYVPPHEE